MLLFASKRFLKRITNDGLIDCYSSQAIRCKRATTKSPILVLYFTSIHPPSSSQFWPCRQCDLTKNMTWNVSYILNCEMWNIPFAAGDGPAWNSGMSEWLVLPHSGAGGLTLQPSHDNHRRRYQKWVRCYKHSWSTYNRLGNSFGIMIFTGKRCVFRGFFLRVLTP